MDEKKQPIFRDLHADDAEAMIVESVCMNCFKDGTTRLLLTNIPFYKEVILMSFSCDECGFRNNEIQSGQEIQLQGNRITLKVAEAKDFNRRVVKSDFTSVRIDEIDFEIPAQSQKGEITTLEGVIERAIAGLEQDQEARREEHPEDAKKIEAFVQKFRNLQESHCFTFSLEDISGNCYIENFLAPHPDPHLSASNFDRTEDQNHLLGIFTKAEIAERIAEIPTEKNSLLQPIAEGEWKLEELHGEVLQFNTNCPECSSPCETNMKVTTIPHFKDVVIMATVCEACGAKTSEVKSGGGIEKQGTRFQVTICDRSDFSRDVLKSETCSLEIPELNCSVGAHALNGRFTTVEGMLVAMRDQLTEQMSLFKDSQDPQTRQKLNTFVEEFEDILASKRKITLVLDDPTGNSYIQSLSDEGLDDRLSISKYDRTFEQNEELGLNDMKTENY